MLTSRQTTAVICFVGTPLVFIVIVLAFVCPLALAPIALALVRVLAAAFAAR